MCSQHLLQWSEEKTLGRAKNKGQPHATYRNCQKTKSSLIDLVLMDRSNTSRIRSLKASWDLIKKIRKKRMTTAYSKFNFDQKPTKIKEKRQHEETNPKNDPKLFYEEFDKEKKL